MCVPFGCAVGPQDGCRTAAKSLLIIKDKSLPTKDKLIWKWIRGAATDPLEFGDPTDGANYSLCIYSGDNANLAAELLVPFGSKWSPSSRGYKYLDKAGSADGAQKIKLRGHATSDKSKALVKGGGEDLPDLDPMSEEQMLALPVKVQLINQGNGLCLEGNYSSSKRNKVTLFKAKQ
jgi:hypothetical protein